ncbi:MAG TPA: GAF domain-containing protein [Pyrinomonadaceae bacterium]
MPEESHLRTLFEHISDPAVVVGGGELFAAGGEVLAANASFAALAGRPESELCGVEVSALLAFEGGASGGSSFGNLFAGDGEGWVPVKVERVPCRWEGREACVLLVRPTTAARDREHETLRPEEVGALFDFLQEATEHVEVVNRVVAAVNSSRTIDEVFKLASQQIGAVVPFDRASIALCEEDCKRLRVFALSGEHAAPLQVGATAPLRGSVTEQALGERRALVIPDLAAETRFNVYDDLQREGFRSAVCVPLFSMERAVGSLNLTSRTPAAYGRRHLLALERLAAPLAIAIEKVLLLEQSERRAREMGDRAEELSGLFEISRTFSTLTDTTEISARLARAIAQLVGGETCLIATYDRKQNAVRAEAGHNTPPELLREFHFALERENTSAPVYLTGEAFLSNDPGRDARLNHSFVERYRINSVLSVPMRIKRELIGFIYVGNRAGGFRERDMRLLEIFSVQAAETIVNARLFLTIQAQAEREAVINRLLLSLQRGGEPRDKIGAVIERIGQVLDLDRCIVVLFSEGEHDDYYGEWCAEGVAPVTHMADVRERSPVRYALRTARRPLIANDVTSHPLAAGNSELVERTQLKSMMVVPIMHLGRVIGSLSAHQTRARREWSEDDIDLLTAVATHVGATLENARLITELREANRLKDEFLATLSHELRTPLTAITGWVDLLSESESARTDRDLADGVAAISASATSLTQLISDLLDLSRIQRGVLRLEREPLDVNQSVTSAARAVRQGAAARRQELHLELAESLPHTIADAHRVQQILWNLLTNAIKFTPQGGRVTVRSRLLDEGLKLGEQGAAGEHLRWIVIEVEDTGEGIPEEFLPFIWDRFRQADGSATRRHGGLGIGLALVKELIEAHGGSAEAESRVGGGTSFSVRLPVIEVEEWMEREPRFQSPRGDGAGRGEFS